MLNKNLSLLITTFKEYLLIPLNEINGVLGYNLIDHLKNEPCPLPILAFFDFFEIGYAGLKLNQTRLLSDILLNFLTDLFIDCLSSFI